MRKPGRLSALLLVAVAIAAVMLRSQFAAQQETPLDSAEPASAATNAAVEFEHGAESIGPDFARKVSEGVASPGCEERAERRSSRTTVDDDTYRAAAKILRDSDDRELQLASALMEPDMSRGARAERVIGALGDRPMSALQHWHKLTYCDTNACDRDAAIAAAIGNDPSNAALWALSASAGIRSGDWQQAADLLRRGVGAGRFDSYYVDHILMMERAYAAGTNMDYAERIVAATGGAAAIALPQLKDLTDACRSTENDPTIWIPLCDEFGEMMSVSSDTYIGTAVGLSLQKIAAQRDEDYAKAAIADDKLDALRKQLRDELPQSGAWDAMSNDAQFLRAYIEHFSARGEVSAIGFVITEANRLRADPTYDQCNFVVKKTVDE